VPVSDTGARIRVPSREGLSVANVDDPCRLGKGNRRGGFHVPQLVNRGASNENWHELTSRL
jgi:hypothetical protein